MFYCTFSDFTFWNVPLLEADPNFSYRNPLLHKLGGVGYGKRGDILDAHILKKGFYFSREGQAIPSSNNSKSIVILSFINSILVQYTINLYTGQHKISGNVNLLPLPQYKEFASIIEKNS